MLIWHIMGWGTAASIVALGAGTVRYLWITATRPWTWQAAPPSPKQIVQEPLDQSAGEGYIPWI